MTILQNTPADMCESRLVRGQLDSSNWFDFIPDSFLMSIIGFFFSARLFDGPRVFLSIPFFLALQVVRWHISPYFLAGGHLIKPNPNGRIPEGIQEILDKSPLRSWWLISSVPPIPFIATLLVLYLNGIGADHPVMGAVRQVLGFFNGEVLRDDLNHPEFGPERNDLIVFLNLIWALAVLVFYRKKTSRSVCPKTAGPAR